MTQESPIPAQPFLIEHRRRNETPQGFVPEARLSLSPALRTSGLLAALSDEQARTLLALVTFVSSNGFVQASARDVSEALSLPRKKARERLERLAALAWEGEPLVHRIERSATLPVYSLSRVLVTHEEQEAPMQQSQPALPPPASREVVIAHSRAAYSTPRSEVERMVAEQLGHPLEESEDTPEGEARRRLLALGVPREQVDAHLAHYPLEEILQQLDWLPYRRAKSPARPIVAAIENRYEPPLAVQREQAMAEDSQTPDLQVLEPVKEAAEIAAEQTVSLPIPAAVGEGQSDE